MTRYFRFALLLSLLAGAMILSVGCGDDDNGTNSSNHAPAILSIAAEPDTFIVYNYTTITVTAEDDDNDPLSYTWDPRASWMLPLASSANILELSNCCEISQLTGGYVVVTVSDGQGGQAVDSIQIWIRPA